MHRYLTAGSRQKGPLAVFHAYGDEAALAHTLDTKVCAKTNPAPVNAMAIHDLRYGWLRDQTGEIIDEVMLACPSPGQRVLMTHGGTVIREQVEEYLKEAGFSPLTEAEFPEVNDPLLDPVLAACVTEGQAAAVLAARARGEIPDAAHILAQHRIVLAGPPNAGKSSLLNALAGYDRAFVDPEAGATRDVVDELIDLNGHAVWIGDLPGYTDHIGMDEIWRKAAQRLRLSEMIWFVADSSEEWGAVAESAASAVAEALEKEETGESPPVLVILNKSDLPRRLAGVPWKKHFPGARSLLVNTLPEGNAVPALEEYAAAAFA